MFVGEAALPDGLRIYAIGDVHGRFDCLNDLLRRIDDDLGMHPVTSSKIIMLGDYCDRGPQTAQAIDCLARRNRHEDFICLMGNHDAKLVSFLVNGEAAGDAFVSFGGDETVRSYGIDSRYHTSYTGLAAELARKMPREHQSFLSDLRPSHVEGDYFFCHAGVRPGVPIESQSTHDLMWIRDEFLFHRGSFGKVVVHGHTPQLEVDVQPNRINVDTCAFDTGVLSCVVLEKRSFRLLQTQL